MFSYSTVIVFVSFLYIDALRESTVRVCQCCSLQSFALNACPGSCVLTLHSSLTHITCTLSLSIEATPAIISSTQSNELIAFILGLLCGSMIIRHEGWFVPDHIEESPEGGREGVGLRSPKQSHVGPGLADVIERGKSVIEEHAKRN